MDVNNETEIQQLVDEIRDLRERKSRLEHDEDQLKDKLRELVEAAGGSWSDEYGYARISAPAERASYSTKGLDNLIIQDPTAYGWLKDYRTVTLGKPVFSVK